jgi:hypothetical protein
LAGAANVPTRAHSFGSYKEIVLGRPSSVM